MIDILSPNKSIEYADEWFSKGACYIYDNINDEWAIIVEEPTEYPTSKLDKLIDKLEAIITEFKELR